MDFDEEDPKDVIIDAALIGPEKSDLERKKNKIGGLKLSAPANMFELREQLIREYHDAPSLAEALSNKGQNNLSDIVMALVDEVIKETDSLLGNELVATRDGNLRDASVISYKRAEVLEKAIRAVQAKQTFDKENGIDVDSPAMMVVFRYFMNQVKTTFMDLGYEDEASDLFFRTLGDSLGDWKKELKAELESMKALNG